MASKNQILAEIILTDKGTLKLVSKGANKAAKSVDNLTQSTKKLRTSRNRFNRTEKGVAENTANTSKAFSKQAQGITGGLVPAYAILAANIFAITAAFGALQRASQLKQLREGLEFTGNAAGINLSIVADKLREITGEAVSVREALTTVALGTSAGFSSKQLEGLTTVARGASLALGRDMEDALSRLARGAAKLEPEILDELGIMVRLDDATERYAATIGKTAADLSQFERRQAFVNAIIDQGTLKFGQLSEAVDVSPYNQLAATFKLLADEGLIRLNKFLGPLVKMLSSSPTALTGTLILFGSTVAKKMIPSLEDMTARSAEAAVASETLSAAQLKNVVALKGVTPAVQKYQTSLNAGTATTKQHAAAVRGATLSYTLNKGGLKDLILTEEIHISAIIRKTGLLINSAKIVNQLALSTFRLAIAQTEQNTIQAISLVQQGSFIAGTRLALAVVKEQFVVTSAGMVASRGLGIANIFLAGTFKIAATGAKFLGAAISRFLPAVGLLVIGFSLLKDFILPLFKSEVTGIASVMEEAESVTAQFVETNEQLTTFLGREGLDSVTAYEGALQAMAGELRSGADVFTSILDELDREAKDKLKSLEATLADFEPKLLDPFFARLFGVEKKQEKIKALELDPEGVAGALKLGENQVNSLIEKIKLLSETGVVSGATIRTLSEDVKDFASVLISAASGGETTREELERVAETYRRTAIAVETLNAAMKGASDLLSDISAFSVLLNKPVGPFAKRIELLDRMAKSLKELRGSPDAIKKLQKGFDALGTTAEGFDDFRVKINRLNKELSETRAIVKGAEADAEGLRGLGGVNNKIAAEQLLQRVLLDRIRVQEETLEIEVLGVKQLLKIEQTRESLQKRLQRSIRKEQIIILKNNVKIARDELVSIQVSKDILGVAQELTDQFNKQLDLKTQIAEADATIVGLGTTRPSEQFRLELEAAKNKITAAKTALAFTIAGIELEFSLLDAKHALLVAQADLSDQQTTPLEQAVLDRTKALMEAQKQGIAGRTKVAELELEAAEKQLGVLIASKIGAIGTEGSGVIGALVDRDRLNIGLQSSDPEVVAQAKRIEEAASSVATIQQVRNQLQGFITDMTKLGPDGEVLAAVAEGALFMAEVFTDAFDRINAGGDRLIAGLQIASAAISSLASITAASSKASIAGIDREIEAEKRRDGKSKESVAKLASLEKKKEAAKRKAFEQDKKLKMASVVINTAAAIVQALASAPPPFSFVLASLVAAMGAAQLAIIASTSFQGGNASTGANAPTSVAVGQRQNIVDLARSRSPSGEIAFFRGEQGVGQGATNFIPGAFTGRAVGGRTAFIAGEQGPELVLADATSSILPADDTESILQAVPNVTFQINAIDAQGVEEVLFKQRGNIISMLREAANSQGEQFFENIEVREDDAR